MNYHFFPAAVLARRAVPAGAIAAFHVLIAYLLLTALVPPPPLPAEKPTVAFFTDPPVVEHPTPPVVRIADRSPRIPTMPPPDAPSPPENPAAHAPVAVPIQHTDDGAGTVAPPLPIRQVGSNVLPNSADYYPPGLIREGVQGATSLRVCVDAQGVRQGEATIEQPSGNALLDRAAQDMARHGRYARAMQGDHPVGNCYRFRITFRIPK